VARAITEAFEARPYGHAEGFAADFCCFMAGSSMGEESTPACRKLTLGAKCSSGILFSYAQVGDDNMEKTLNRVSSRPWGGEVARAHSASRRAGSSSSQRSADGDPAGDFLPTP
jgi:hypothetical protein